MAVINKAASRSAIAAMIMLAFASGAWAGGNTQNGATRQTDAESGQTKSNDPPRSQNVRNNNEPTKLGTVIVTATRRERPQQSVPGRVTALQGSFLEQINAHDFEQYAHFVPGLSFDSLGPTANLIAIRGITTGGTQLSSGIGMYLDQVPIGASTPFGVGFQTLPVSTFDLNRVEVLNGPQGTLYGANALGGAIKYVPAAPELNHFETLGTLTASQTAHAATNGRGAIMVNAPIARGKVGVRVDVLDGYQTGFGNNVALDLDNRGSSHTRMGRVQVLGQVTPDFSIKFLGYWQKVEGDGLNVDFRNIANSQPVLGTYKQAFALRQNERNSLSLASLIINWKFDGATLTSISGDQNNVGTTLTDLSAVYNPLLAPVFGPQVYGFVTDTSTRKYTEEIRLESNGDSRIEWLVGLYGAYEKTHELVNLRNHGAPNGLLLGFSPFYGVLPSTYHELSAFGDVTFHITDAFALKLGARESRNSQHYQQFAHGLLVVPTAPAMTTHEDASSDQSVATYLINPSYRLSKHFMLYAKVASGYRPGGPNFHLALGNAPPTFKPDKLWSYELGEKATFLNGRAVLNADIYDIDWSQIQLTVNNGGVNQITNGGDARIKGAELRAAFQITSHFRLMASGSWTDASLTSAVPALGLAQSGARLPISPRNKAALAASYRFNIGPRSGGRVTLSDSWIGDRMAGYAGSIVAPAYHLPGYNTLNLDVAFYMPHGIEIDAFLHNALDRVGQVSATTVANEYDPTAPVPVVLSRPRTIGVQFTFDFGHYE